MALHNSIRESAKADMQTLTRCDLNENNMPLSEPSTSRRSGGNDTHLGDDDQDMNGFFRDNMANTLAARRD